MINIANVLSKEEISAILSFLEEKENEFEDGKKTAGWRAKKVKNNEQLDAKIAGTIEAKTKKALLANPIFVSAARPKTFVKVLVSRYRPGMEYGLHVDDALMGGVRTDLSFTLFLSDPASYDGGELVIEGNDGDTEVKLDAGSLILYSTTTLHRVAPVSRGERIAIVGWVRSYIRGNEQREVLFDVDQVIAGLAGTIGGDIERLMKVRANLTRFWAED